MRALRTARHRVAAAFRQLVGSQGSDDDHIKSFLSLRDTLEQAKLAGQSVGDYIDTRYQVPGATRETIQELAQCGVLNDKVETICEIGPGSGRYLEHVVRLCKPKSYEIYETAREWSNWLVETYHVTGRQPDGISLRHTASRSVDLVHAHKVFVYLDFIVSFQYFEEMVRVTRSGGYIVFDIVSERCMPEADIEKWAARRIYYPHVIPREMVIAFFVKRQCSLHYNFFAPLLLSRSEYFVFLKGQDPRPESSTAS